MSVRRTSGPPRKPPAGKTAKARGVPAGTQQAVKAVEQAVENVVKKLELGFLPRPKAMPKTLGKDGFAGLQARGSFAPPRSGQWTLDAQGRPADPVTIYAHGSLSQVESALAADGWSKADPRGLSSNAKYTGAALAEGVLGGVEKLDGGAKSLPPFQSLQKGVTGEVNEMPVSPQTYNGRPILAAFERNNNPLGGRDHLRIFDTGQKDANGQPVYAIAASRDSGLRFAPDHPESGFMFHTVQADVSSERDAVLASLTKHGAALQQQLPLSWSGTSIYGEKVGDGKAYEVAF